METLFLQIAGMTCENCVGHVSKALASVDGVTAATVDLENGQAVVTGSLDKAALAAAVAEAGYAIVD